MTSPDIFDSYFKLLQRAKRQQYPACKAPKTLKRFAQTCVYCVCWSIYVDESGNVTADCIQCTDSMQQAMFVPFASVFSIKTFFGNG